jgi:ABC-type multidrug transport system fused ATPase/permease subunit
LSKGSKKGILKAHVLLQNMRGSGRSMKVFSFSQTVYKIRWLLSRHQKASWAFLGGLSLLASVFELMTAATVGILAYVLGAPPEEASKMKTLQAFLGPLSPEQTVLWAALLCGGAYAIKNTFLGFESYYQNKTIQAMLNQFRTRLLAIYTKRPYVDFISKNTTHRFELIENDAEQFFLLGMKSLAAGFSEAMMGIVLCAAIFYIHPTLALCISALALSLIIVIYTLLMPRFYKLGQTWQTYSLHARQRLLELFHAFKDITLMGRSDFFIQHYRTLSQKRGRARALDATLGELPKLIFEAAFVGMAVFAIWFLMRRQSPLHEIYAVLGLYVYAGFRLIPITVRLTGYGNHLALAQPFIERLYTEIRAHNVCLEPADTPITFHASLTFEDVSFSYPGASQKALSHVSLTIPQGSCVGIVGQTGSGKSTLLDLLLGLLVPDSGEIRLDGHASVHNKGWHRMIGYVPQAPYLIDDTLARNIALGEDHLDYDRLRAVIAQAQLTPLIDTLPKGIDTPIGEKGVRLSGGERQRLAIARALYNNPAVLVFDEATSALDSDTEKHVIDTLHSVSKDRTLIMVAHRVTTLSRCDTIFVLNKGQIQQTTSYDALVASL